jgi:hypothetical protein
MGFKGNLTFGLASAQYAFSEFNYVNSLFVVLQKKSSFLDDSFSSKMGNTFSSFLIAAACWGLIVSSGTNVNARAINRQIN